MNAKYIMMVPLKLLARESHPEDPHTGEMYFNTEDDAVMVFDGTNWSVFQGGISEVAIADDLTESENETTELWVDTDAVDGSVGTGQYLPLIGGTLTGRLNIDIGSTTSNNALIVEKGKIVVQDAAGGVVIPQTTDETPGNYAVTKKYVDDLLFGDDGALSRDTTWNYIGADNPGNPEAAGNPNQGFNSPLWVDTSSDGGAVVPGSGTDTTWNFIGPDAPDLDPTTAGNPYPGFNSPLWVDTNSDYPGGTGTGNGAYGDHLVVRSGGGWRYRGKTVTARPSVPGYSDGARVVWDTSLDPDFMNPPPLAVVGDVWIHHGDVEPSA